jgi:hypothetical protein
MRSAHGINAAKVDISRETAQGEFAGRVSGEAGETDTAEHRTYVDDAPVTPLDHLWQHVTGHLQGDLDVYLDQSLYHARVLLVESNEIHHTGEIDENIDTPLTHESSC